MERFEHPGEDLRNFNFDDVASLVGANLEGANLQGVVFAEGTDFTGANLKGAHLEGTKFIRARLDNAELDGAFLRDTDFTDASLVNATLTNADFDNPNFLRTRLDGATISAEDRTWIRPYITREQRRRMTVEEEEDNDTGAQYLARARQEAFQRQLPQEVPQQVQQPVHREGVAYEVHNLFDSLDMPSINQYIKSFNDTHPENSNTTSSSSQSGNNLFAPLLSFIDNSRLFASSEKGVNKQKLNRILTRLTTIENFEQRFKRLLESVVNFVSRQDDVFIEQYIRILSDECLNAYGAGYESCVKGTNERVLTTVNSVAMALTTDPKYKDDQNYNDIKKLFNKIDFNELVKAWAALYLEDGEKHDEFKVLTEPQKKEHFIEFMKKRYGMFITPGAEKQINDEANEYEKNHIFERMAFGGKKNKKTRRNTKTTKRTKRTRMTKKSRRNRRTVKRRRK
jgi:hypothetical protein